MAFKIITTNNVNHVVGTPAEFVNKGTIAKAPSTNINIFIGFLNCSNRLSGIKVNVLYLDV